MKTVTITEFRKNIFRMADEAVAKGETLEIKRPGGRLIVTGEATKPAENRRAKIERLLARTPSPEWEGFDLSLENIDGAGAGHWTWHGESEVDR